MKDIGLPPSFTILRRLDRVFHPAIIRTISHFLSYFYSFPHTTISYPFPSMPQFNILIVGAGIAGLSTAISLRRNGHIITVLERHPACQALGGPVGLSSNATRVLIEYGMGDIMAKRDSGDQNIICQRRYDSGEILGSRTNDQTMSTYGFPWVLLISNFSFCFSLCVWTSNPPYLGRKPGSKYGYHADWIQRVAVRSLSTTRDAVRSRAGTRRDCSVQQPGCGR